MRNSADSAHCKFNVICHCWDVEAKKWPCDQQMTMLVKKLEMHSKPALGGE
jgi:hypothetical protein